MGNRHPANEHGIYSASLYCVHGRWLRGLVVLAVTARRLLVGDTREARASSVVCRNHSRPDSHVSAGGLVDTAAYDRYLICSLPLLLILMAEGIDWLARSVWQRRAAIAAWGLTALVVVCWTPLSGAVSRQKTLAVCSGGQVSGYTDAKK